MKGANNLKDTEVNDMNQEGEKVKLRQEINKELIKQMMKLMKQRKKIK